MKKESPSSKLRETAKLRLQQLCGSALFETGEGLPPKLLADIEFVVNGPHKTFRYMLVTGLLVAVTDSLLDPLCLQMNAGGKGAYDARSLCQKVVVPFEKTYLQGRLGASNEPFANKSTRFAMIDRSNNVRKGVDTFLLNSLCDLFSRPARSLRRGSGSTTAAWNSSIAGLTTLISAQRNCACPVNMLQYAHGE